MNESEPRSSRARARSARRDIDEIFGEILPDTTGDEREPAEGADRDRDVWYRENRPPHHG
ncbi:hypothetical protein [Actinopolyspora mortivallis]|uniref:hypothetical protein n=1 Tax=Actinopolyspora mortivallis TaxID=33906 RepID=UPI00047B05F7|nr:hypothetical protein [Actinopolyspora mortivallis]